MAYPQFDPSDASIMGPAVEALRDPRVVLVTAQPDGVPFDYNRPQQTWKIDGATDDISAFKLATDPKTHAIDFDNPRLVAYAVPLAWAGKPNVQPNPSKDGFTVPYSPVPLRVLADDEHLVSLGAGTWNFPQVYLRKGAAPTPPPAPSIGGGLTADQENKLNFLVQGMKTLLGQ